MNPDDKLVLENIPEFLKRPITKADIIKEHATVPVVEIKVAKIDPKDLKGLPVIKTFQVGDKISTQFDGGADVKAAGKIRRRTNKMIETSKGQKFRLRNTGKWTLVGDGDIIAIPR